MKKRSAKIRFILNCPTCGSKDVKWVAQTKHFDDKDFPEYKCNICSNISTELKKDLIS